MKYCMVNVFVGSQMEFKGISLVFRVARDYHVRTPHRQYLGSSNIERYPIKIRLLLKQNVVYIHLITLNVYINMFQGLDFQIFIHVQLI